MSWKHYNTETETLEISGYLPTELERFVNGRIRVP